MNRTFRTSGHRRTASAVLATAAATATAALALSACSGSSSDGSSGSGASGQGAPSLSPVPGISSPGVYGPNGVITKPTFNPPEKTSPGGSTVYPHVSGKLEQSIANHVVTMDGVVRVTNYPQFKQIQVYFEKGATTEQRQAVYRYITRRDPAAAGG